MPKIRKIKRKKRFRVNVNRKRMRNKLRKVPAIGCAEIKEAWEVTKSTRNNLNEMGLALDPNEVLKIPNVKREFIESAKRNVRDIDDKSDDDREMPKKLPPKIHVAQKLEAEARAPRERLFQLPKGQVQFITYMMDKYGDDYKAMARDRRNYYQLTWCQLRAKVNTFKGIPEQYAEYLLKKGEIVLDDPTPLEVTKKQIAEENFKKYCKPKQRRVKKTKPLWEEESINGDETNIKDMEQNENESSLINDKERDLINTDNDSQKKLKLFSDDENDEEGDKRKATTKSKLKRSNKNQKIIEKSQSSESESEEELEADDGEAGFVDLSDMSDEELSDDDILDDGEFVTDSDDASD